MKTKYFMFALAALLLAGCSDDEIDSGGGSGLKPEAGKTAFGFALKDFAKGSVPLSKADPDPLDKLPASVAESTIDSLSIYVFDQHADTPYDSTTTVFAEEFKIGENQLTATGADKTASIQLNGTGKKKIYFIANAIGQHDMDRLKLGETTEAQFLAMKTNALTTADQLACPLIMTAIDSVQILDADDTATPEVTGYTIKQGTTVASRPITLKRIVSRFDIENYAETSDLVIEGIVLNKVHPSALINKVNNFKATKNAEYLYSGDTQLEEMQQFDFTRYPNANNGRVASAFYLYPDMNNGKAPETGEGDDADRFYLTLYGKTRKTGAKVVYNVYMYEDNSKTGTTAGAAPIIVKPNNQYLIKINDLDPTRLSATITVEDWLIGDTISYEMSLGSIALSCVEFPLTEVIADGSGQLLTLPAARADGNGRPVNVAVDAISEWELAKGYNAAWIDTTTNIDPADLPVGTLATVLPQTANPYKNERRGTLVFRNVQRPSIMQTLVVVQKGNAAAVVPVAIGKLSATGDYTVVNRPTDGTTDAVGVTEKTDTLMLAATGGGNPTLLAKTEYKDIVVSVDSCGDKTTSIQQEWAIRVDVIDSTWIHVTDQPGLNQHGKSFKFDLVANDTTLARTGAIRLYDRQDATIYRDLVIVQAGKGGTGEIVKVEDRTADDFTDLEAATGETPQHYDYTLGIPVNKTTGKPYQIKLTTNAAWSIDDLGDTAYRNWLKAYALDGTNKRIMSGTGDAVIEIGTTLNDSASVRTGFVTLRLATGVKVIKVTQEASVPVITLDDRHITDGHIDFPAVKADGSAIYEAAQFITNDNWTVKAFVNDADGNATAAEADWLTFSNSKDATDAALTGGSGSMVLKITAKPQEETGGAGTGAAARSATVTITCEHPTTNGGTDNPAITLDIYQAGIEANP
ncbi:fimbrial protein [Parabacteroides segnis]|uniref:fimbrial protein n=1 Tax=Parabacteroides segnis TaxID=2763058 RepID=UPI003517FB28